VTVTSTPEQPSRPTRPPVPAPPPDPSTGPRDTSADLFDYALLRDWARFLVRAVLRHRVVAAACLAVVLGAAISSLWLLPRRWQVQARLLAQRNPVMWTLSNPGMPRPFDWDAPARAARETVLRRDNLVALARQTDFVNRYLARRAPAVRAWHWVREVFTGPRSQDRLLEDLVDTLQNRLWVTVGAEGTVTITFEWSDPEIAYLMVEAAVENFLEVRHAQEVAIVGETISILEVHASRLQRQIDEGVEKLREKEKLYKKASARPTRPVPARRSRTANDDEVARLKALLAAKRRALSDLVEFRQRKLEELQAQLLKLEAVYADQHPDVVSTNQNIESLKAPSPQINELDAEVLDLEREVVRRGGQVGDVPRITPMAAMTEGELLGPFGSPREDEDPRLEYERGQLRLLLRQYTGMLERIEGAQMEIDTVKAAFKYRYTIITPPLMPRKPLKPNPLVVLAAGVLGGVLFAVFAAVVIDLRSGRVVERWQLERSLGLPVLAEIRR
jgi:uncharacterized protein involved in exopolysaccharide biosynthesis